MVSLPDGIGTGCFPTMNQFECVAVRLRAFVSQGEEIGGELVNDVIDDRIAGLLPHAVERLPAPAGKAPQSEVAVSGEQDLRWLV